MTHRIDLVSYLTKIAPRPNDPYWGAPIQRGHFLGYRKSANGSGTWMARMPGTTTKYQYEPLGLHTPDFGYDEARVAACAWFSRVSGGADGPVPTVREACKEYIAEKTANDGARLANKIGDMIGMYIYTADIADCPLDKLTVKAIKDWRNGLTRKAVTKTGRARTINAGKPLSNGTKNRAYSALLAALNLAAVNHASVTPTISAVWKTKGNIKVLPEESPEAVYLSPEQRLLLLHHCTAEIALFAEGGVHTGARPDELSHVRAKHFDAAAGTLFFPQGKTGGRTIPLSGAAQAFFKRVCDGKDAEAYIFVRPKGEKWHHTSSWSKPFKKAVESAKLNPRATFYSLRHSWITDALQNGMPMPTVATLCGTSPKMIMKTYFHLGLESARMHLNAIEMLPARRLRSAA
jgi:integrase